MIRGIRGLCGIGALPVVGKQCILAHVHVLISIVSDTDSTHSNKLRNAFLSIFPFVFLILTVYSFAFCFVNIQLAHKPSRSVPKMSLNASLHGLGEIGNHMCT